MSFEPKFHFEENVFEDVFYKGAANCTVFLAQCADLSAAKAIIFWENHINSMAVDDLAPCTAKAPAALVMNMYDKHIVVLHEVGFQLPAPSQGHVMIESANIYFCFLQTIQHFFKCRKLQICFYI